MNGAGRTPVRRMRDGIVIATADLVGRPKERTDR